MAPSPQGLGLSGLTGVLGGLGGGQGAVSSLVAAVPAITSTLPVSVPAIAVPSVVPVAGTPAISGLPNLSIPTGSVLEITKAITVPLASTSLLASLASLPVNSGLPGLEGVLDALSDLPLPTAALPADLPLSMLPTDIIALLPTDLPLSLPLSAPLSLVPTAIQSLLPTGLPADLPISALPIQIPSLPTGLPLVPLAAISPVQEILANLGTTLITTLAEQLANIISTIVAAAANVPLSGANVTAITPAGRMKMAAPAEEKRQLDGLFGGLLGGLNLGAVTGVTSGLTGGLLANSNPLSSLTGSTLAPLTDGTLLPVGSIVSGLTGQSGGSLLAGLQDSVGSNPLSLLTGLLSGLSLSGGPLGSVTGVLGNLGLGSIILNIVCIVVFTSRNTH